MPGRPVVAEGLQKTFPERRAAHSGRQEGREGIRQRDNAKSNNNNKHYTTGMM